MSFPMYPDDQEHMTYEMFVEELECRQCHYFNVCNELPHCIQEDY